MPARLAASLGLTDVLRAIPIVEPEATHTIGLSSTGTRANDDIDRGTRCRSTPRGTAVVGLSQQKIALCLVKSLTSKDKLMTMLSEKLIQRNDLN